MTGRLGLFRLAGRGYAVPLERLLHVIDVGLVDSLPLSPDQMVGILVIDNEIIPVLDSNWLPGVSPGLGANAAYKVLIATEYGPVALPAEATVGIVADNRGERIGPDEETVAFLPDSFRYRQDLYQILDVDVFIMSLICS